jgi:hypothetical protein
MKYLKTTAKYVANPMVWLVIGLFWGNFYGQHIGFDRGLYFMSAIALEIFGYKETINNNPDRINI